MMKDPRFFVCKHCGNMVDMIHSSGVPMICCGEKMTELVAGSTDAATEKHVPVIAIDGNEVKVTVGAVAHPMVEEHYITWIYLHTEKGIQRKHLNPGEEPSASFALTADDKVIAAYEYCNLHGLWVAKA